MQQEKSRRCFFLVALSRGIDRSHQVQQQQKEPEAQQKEPEAQQDDEASFLREWCMLSVMLSESGRTPCTQTTFNTLYPDYL